MTRVVLAVDVGGTKSAVGLVTDAGEVLAERRRPAEAERGPDAMIGDYVEMAREALSACGLALPSLAGVGVGCGGPLDPESGTILGSPNLPGWDEVPLARRLGEHLDRPVWVDNDGNAAALGEYRFGAGRRQNPLVYFTVSTGVGGGVVVNGRIVHGATGNAAELGHLIVRAGGRRCPCGGRGCLEAYCSGTGIAARAREAVEGSPASTLASLGRPPRAEDVVMAAVEGDELAHAVWDETLDLLAAGVASAIHAFDPSCVLLGGGVTAAGDALFPPLRARVQDLVMPHFRPRLDIRPAALGARVGLLGAAAVALSHLSRTGEPPTS